MLSDSPQVWDDLISAVGPASLLVLIESRMGRSVRARQSSEDILQDALLLAWRDRAGCQWRGIKSFRSWLLSIIDNRIHDVADRDGAQKRGGRTNHQALSPAGGVVTGNGERDEMPGPLVSTTPSRVAMYKEHCRAMQTALEALPPDLADVVRLRLFEQMTLEEIARHLNIGVSAVRHRFRGGAELYHRRLVQEMASRPSAIFHDSAPEGLGNSSALES